MSVDWTTVVVSAAINTPTVAGLLGWLGKRRLQNEMAQHHAELEALKAEYGKQLEAYKAQLEQSKLLLQADLNKTILVTKAHFETEFEALKAVFAKLAEVKLQMAGLRPQMRVGPAAESPAVRLERLTEQINAFQKAYNALLEISEHVSAFYPPNIYEQLGACLRKANAEIVDLRISGQETFSHDWYGRGRSNFEEFLTSFSEVSALIRDRISNLAIVRTG